MTPQQFHEPPARNRLEWLKHEAPNLVLALVMATLVLGALAGFVFLPVALTWLAAWLAGVQ